MVNRKRPSFYLLAASLFVLVAALTALQPSEVAENDQSAALLARGWVQTERVSCAELRRGAFYEIENESASAEILFLGDKSLASQSPLPEAPYSCREISEPHYIAEIL